MLRKTKHKIGYALSGGGARAFAHLGAIQALQEQGIRPEIISGVSAGSLAGVFIADGYEPAEIMEIFGKMKFMEFAEPGIPHNGIFKTSRLQALLKKHLKATRFEDLQIPFIAIASDFDKGKTVVFSKGTLYAPVVASCSFPVVFAPTIIDDISYIDGGLFRNFPVSFIRNKVKTVIGINVCPPPPQKNKDNLKSIIEKCVHYVLDVNSLNDDSLCDILIKPQEIANYSIFELKMSDEIYKIGYDAAKKTIFENKKRLKLK